MIEAQNQKIVSAIAPVSINAGSSTAIAVDTLGFDYAQCFFHSGAMAAALTVATVTECETSGGSYTAITGGTLDGGTDMDGTTVVLPSATDDGLIQCIEFPLVERMRYLKMNVTGAAGANLIAGTVILSRAEETPKTSALRGCEHVKQL